MASIIETLLGNFFPFCQGGQKHLCILSIPGRAFLTRQTYQFLFPFRAVPRTIRRDSFSLVHHGLVVASNSNSQGPKSIPVILRLSEHVQEIMLSYESLEVRYQMAGESSECNKSRS